MFREGSPVTEPVLQANPRVNYIAHKEEIDAAIHRVLESGWYILAKEVESLEKEFAGYLGADHAIGVASGTDALHLAFRACGVGPGDSIITTSNTAVATAAAIVSCGAAPFFVDIDPLSFTMDPNFLEDAIKRFPSRRFRAVVPVHLYGHPADMESILDIANRYSLFVIEDCAQSHGATIQGKKTGTWGHLAAFSFYPTKNLGGLGDGGMIIARDEELAGQARLLREYGWKQRYISTIPGFNSRLDEIQAAVLRVKLRYLDQENDKRIRLAGVYSRFLEQSGIILPQSRPGVIHVYHQYVIRTERRNALKEYLFGKGINTLIHYPVPVHQQPAYADYPDDFVLSLTEKLSLQILSLPLFPELDEKKVETVSRHILGWSKQISS